jgi:hypothetical protein
MVCVFGGQIHPAETLQFDGRPRSNAIMNIELNHSAPRAGVADPQGHFHRLTGCLAGRNFQVAVRNFCKKGRNEGKKRLDVARIEVSADINSFRILHLQIFPIAPTQESSHRLTKETGACPRGSRPQTKYWRWLPPSCPPYHTCRTPGTCAIHLSI